MHQADEVAVHELRRRQVDRDLQRLRPRRRLAAGLAQNPFAHFDDQAAFFRQRNEIAGRDKAAGRMHPARQRLEAGDVVADNVLAGGGLRLVVQRQFAVADRRGQILMQRAAIADLLVHLGLEQADRAARFRLGAEQRGVGIGEQRRGVVAVARKHRDAGGDADVDRSCRRSRNPLPASRRPARPAPGRPPAARRR